ncbi:MAG: long-chain fatty acid--CoA ligase [bacterium]
MTENIYNLTKNSVKNFKDRCAIYSLKKSCVETLSYEKLMEEVHSLARGMINFGVSPGDRVIILSENRTEWYVAILAISLTGAVAVPLYTTASNSQLEYIIHDSGASFGFISKLSHYNKIASVAEKLFIKSVLFDYDPAKKTEYSNITAIEHFKDDRKMVRDPGTSLLAKPEEPAVLIYTSGTTGEPKGVILTHENITSNVKMLQPVVGSLSELRYLSLLPLSHAYEFTVIQTLFSLGGTIIPVSHMARVVDYIQETSPTVSCAVPRLFEKIYHTVLRNVENSSLLTRKMFENGMAVGDKIYRLIEKNETIPFPENIKYIFYRKLVFEKIRQKTISSIKLFISGGAALMPEISRFFNILGTTIVEGYGITECSPVVSVNMPDNRDTGTVGPPLKGVDILIKNNGELCVKGKNVMKKYWKKPEATSAAFDENGYFRTGDIAIWTDNKKLKIIGRIKDIIVMANGKNVSPLKIENALKSDPLIDAVCVMGDEKKYLTALIVPDMEELKKHAEKKEFHFKDENDLINHPGILSFFDRKVQEVNRIVEHHEKIRKYRIINDNFSVETGELTPTLKIRRQNVLKKYRHIFEELYEVS